LRGRKATAFEGGIRVPCFIRWPVRLQPLSKVDRIAAHIDIAPTLLEACGVAKPTGVNFDGKSLMPLLTGQADEWPDRTLYFQSHRGDVPELYRNAAARSQRYKLVQTEGSFGKPMESDPVFELYDMLSDPFEQNNLANEYPDILAKLKQGYENWIRDVGGTRGYAPPRIHLGTPHENPVVLTRQDWRANGPGWGLTGHWEVQVAEAGTYDIMLRFATVEEAGATAHVTLTPATDDVQARETNAWDAGIPGACDRHTFRGVRLGPGPARLDAWIARGNESVGVHYVDVQRID
jgi:arylsulfatase/arylsulfatase A